MGYIFDALNKKNGEPPEGQSPTVVASDSSAPVQETKISPTGLADLMAITQQDETPLRLADLQLSIDTDDNGNTVIDTKDASRSEERSA